MRKRGVLGFAGCIAGVLWLAAAFGGEAPGRGFLAVTGPCGFEFPRDHAPHPGFRTEWWYYTGNLKTEAGRRFGYQLTFFRYQLTPFGGSAAWPDPPSAWRTRQIYSAHAALSDLSARRHLQAERIGRNALGIAGWLQYGQDITLYHRGWSIVIFPDRHKLQAADEEFAFALELKPAKPPVFHGRDGYSRKGSTPERASCYYSFSRLETQGTVTLGGKTLAVQGQSWMDHEYGTAPLEEGIVGWDWFSLQLSDQSEFMLYLLRREDGSLADASSGSYIDSQGTKRHLESGYFVVEALDSWKSPRSGAVYPASWRIRIPLLGIDLLVKSNLADQEMHTAGTTGVVYWEGSVSARGTKGGGPVEGVGFVELTG
ncbi:MAG: lipocalin-like domain-containing protein, partial [Desulfobacterales bacterium]